MTLYTHFRREQAGNIFFELTLAFALTLLIAVAAYSIRCLSGWLSVVHGALYENLSIEDYELPKRYLMDDGFLQGGMMR
ncbi:MAG: hypothetical protein RH946_19940 [Rhodospirillales bacterium]